MVRTLDYSLDKLGKYKGIVYRNGFMGTDEGQYYSTSRNPEIVDRIDIDSGEILGEYSVIRTKSGHKIVDFQKKMNDTYAEEEEEILLDRHAKYRKVPIEECDGELLKAREHLARSLFGGMGKHITDEDKNFPVFGYTRQDLLNLIRVYEED